MSNQTHQLLEAVEDIKNNIPEGKYLELVNLIAQIHRQQQPQPQPQPQQLLRRFDLSPPSPWRPSTFRRRKARSPGKDHYRGRTRSPPSD